MVKKVTKIKKDSKKQKKMTQSKKAPASKKKESKKLVQPVTSDRTVSGKTEIVLSMVSKGNTRKEILDFLVALNPNVSRKSNAALVSSIFKKYNLSNVPSGVRKERKVKETLTDHEEFLQDDQTDYPITPEEV